jgi:hypothetical protein
LFSLHLISLDQIDYYVTYTPSTHSQSTYNKKAKAPATTAPKLTTFTTAAPLGTVELVDVAEPPVAVPAAPPLVAVPVAVPVAEAVPEAVAEASVAFFGTTTLS